MVASSIDPPMGCAEQPDLAGCHAVGAEDRARHLGAAGADQAAQADDFAGAHGQIDAGKAARAGEIFDFQRHVAGGRPRRPRIGRIHRPADHRRDELVRRGVLRQQVGNLAAVAQHGDAVAKREHFRQAVRYVDDRDAFRLQPRDHGKQLFGFVVGKRRRRLIHDQNARVLRQCLGDFDHLLLGDTEAVHRQARIDIEADPVEHALGLGVGTAAVDQPGQPARKFAAEKNILGDVEIGHEREVLENDGNAELARRAGVVNRHGFAVAEEFAAVGAIGAAQDLHQGRFAGAIFADQHVYFAGAYFERHVVERFDAGEFLGDPAQFK